MVYILLLYLIQQSTNLPISLIFELASFIKICYKPYNFINGLTLIHF